MTRMCASPSSTNGLSLLFLFCTKRGCHFLLRSKVASPWSTANPCNYHHRELTDLVCDAIERRGGKAFVAGTPIVSDGMTQGTVGMRYSLPSRDLIADCVETMHEAYAADGVC